MFLLNSRFTNCGILASFLAIVMLLPGCLGKRKRTQKLSLDENKALTMQDLTTTEGQKTKKKRSQGEAATGTNPVLPPKKSAKTKSRSKESEALIAKRCLSLYGKHVNPYRKLLGLHGKQASIPQSHPALRMASVGPDACVQEQQRTKFLEAMVNGLSVHSGKVGVLLPLSGSKGALAQALLKGMQAAAQDRGIRFEDRFVVRDTQDNQRRAEQELADLVFTQQVSMLIGGFDQHTHQVLRYFGDSLAIPTYLISREDAAGNKHQFRVYPDEVRLADSLASAAVAKGMKRIAVLRPANGKSDAVIDAFKAAFSAQGGVVTETLHYSANNFEAMDAAARSLFRIDPQARRAEFQAAFWKTKARAKREGLPFDPRLVVLKPLINVDALFIPDDFRTIRYFAKIFKYHGVEQLPLIGNHEWRSPALVEPYDPFLEGSFFADFIGSYQDLPSPIRAPLMNGPYFVQPQHVMDIDFQLIGYRAASLGIQALSQPETKRFKLSKAVTTMQMPRERFFDAGPAFSDKQKTLWPTFVFEVRGGSINLMPKPAQASVSPPAGMQSLAREGETAKRGVIACQANRRRCRPQH